MPHIISLCRKMSYSIVSWHKRCYIIKSRHVCYIITPCCIRSYIITLAVKGLILLRLDEFCPIFLRLAIKGLILLCLDVCCLILLRLDVKGLTFFRFAVSCVLLLRLAVRAVMIGLSYIINILV